MAGQQRRDAKTQRRKEGEHKVRPSITAVQWEPRITHYGLRITDYALRITHYGLPGTFHASRSAFGLALLRCHADCTVEADDFAIEHLVFDDVGYQGTVFLWAAQPRGEGHLLAQGLAHIVGQAR